MSDPIRKIPLYTLSGVENANITTHYITTEDQLGLSMLRFERKPCDDVVLLLHGLTTSTDMFVMPEHYNIVNYLHQFGYTDVWSFDWRGSNRHNYDLFPTAFNLDDIALFDHPAALEHIRETVGPDKRIHVICHCVGSISFMMSLAAGLIKGITSVVSNSVSLTPHVPRWSSVKLALAPFFVTWVLRFPYISPRWGYLPGPGIPQGKLLSKCVDLFHPECHVPACHMASFMWGAGRPACYEHDNLLPVTHERIGDLFGAINMSYYRHIHHMVKAGRAIKMKPGDPKYAALPDNYLQSAAHIETPVLFLSGDENRVFEDSNQRTFDALNGLQPNNRNEFQWLPGYGHQDPFMGKANHENVFPVIVDWLNRRNMA